MEISNFKILKDNVTFKAHNLNYHFLITELGSNSYRALEDKLYECVPMYQDPDKIILHLKKEGIVLDLKSIS